MHPEFPYSRTWGVVAKVLTVASGAGSDPDINQSGRVAGPLSDVPQTPSRRVCALGQDISAGVLPRLFQATNGLDDPIPVDLVATNSSLLRVFPEPDDPSTFRNQVCDGRRRFCPDGLAPNMRSPHVGVRRPSASRVDAAESARRIHSLDARCRNHDQEHLDSRGFESLNQTTVVSPAVLSGHLTEGKL